jgi:hypothetical protein
MLKQCTIIILLKQKKTRIVRKEDIKQKKKEKYARTIVTGEPHEIFHFTD